MHRSPAIFRARPGPRLTAFLAILLVAGTLFVGWLHPRVADPTNIGWLLDGEDRGQNAAGLAAYLRAPPPWPSTRQTLLSAPEGATLLFTDSNPLLGLALRPIARWLPVGIQFVGPWLLLCVVLQSMFAWLLLRRWTTDAVAAGFGTLLLAAAPVLINRVGHPNLCAQWLILWALWIYLDPRRARHPGWWMAVVGVSALVHSYLLLMVAAIWATATLRALVCEPGRGRLVAGAGLVAAMAALLVSLHGVVGETFQSTGTFGRFAMAIDAWWNPSNSNFEGLQYIGGGLLFLGAAAVFSIATGACGAQVRGMLRRLAWLLPAFAVLGLLALGDEWTWRGRVVVDLPLSPSMLAALDPIRAAGRLFWPATYALSLVVIVLTLQLQRARFLLIAACAIQIANIWPFVATVRADTASAARLHGYRRTVDPRWATLIARSGSVGFQPADPFLDLQLVEEVQWRAIMACRPTSVTYTSRQTAQTRARLAREERDFGASRLDPTRLYVLLDREPAWAVGHVRELDGVRFIAPSRPAPPPICG